MGKRREADKGWKVGSGVDTCSSANVRSRREGLVERELRICVELQIKIRIRVVVPRYGPATIDCVWACRDTS